MKVYTKTGDSGETSLFSGGRVTKNDHRIEAYGTLDELNSLIGLLRAEPLPAGLDNQLDRVQRALFDIGAKVADAENRIQANQAAWRAEPLELWIDEMSRDLPSLKNFLLPGGSRGAALAHCARTVCRRAERNLITAHEVHSCSPEGALPYLNRLSDALFVAARFINLSNGVVEPLWSSGEA